MHPKKQLPSTYFNIRHDATLQAHRVAWFYYASIEWEYLNRITFNNIVLCVIDLYTSLAYTDIATDDTASILIATKIIVANRAAIDQPTYLLIAKPLDMNYG